MLLQLVSVVTLARLLTPSDFGLVALALLVIGFGELFRDFGLSQAAVQATTLSRDQRTNLFWINTGIGVLLSLLTFAASWALAAIAGEPEARVICQALAITFLLNAMAAQFRAGLMRDLRFATLAAIEIGSATVGLVVAIVLAAVGAGFWALVGQQLTTIALTLVLLVIAGRWMPGLPNRRGDVRDFLRFGWNLVASQLVNYAAANTDTALVGLRYGPSTLGLYNRVYQLIVVPVGQVRAPLTNVAVPVLSRLKDSVGEFGRFVLRAQLLLGYALCLPLGLVAVAAEPIVELALGSHWLGAVFFLRCFAVASIFQTLAYVGFWIYVSRGLTAVLFRYSMVSAAIKIACVLVGSLAGPEGIALGFAVAPALSWPISLWWLSRHVQLPIRGLYAGAFRMLCASAVAAVPAIAVILFVHVDAIWLIALALVAFVAGAAVLLVLPVYRRDLRDIAATVRLLRPGRRPSTGAGDSVLTES